jgi:hypothetical protein
MSSGRKLSGCDGPSDGVVVDAEAAEAGAVGKAAAEATREERDGDDDVMSTHASVLVDTCWASKCRGL